MSAGGDHSRCITEELFEWIKHAYPDNIAGRGEDKQCENLMLLDRHHTPVHISVVTTQTYDLLQQITHATTNWLPSWRTFPGEVMYYNRESESESRSRVNRSRYWEYYFNRTFLCVILPFFFFLKTLFYSVHDKMFHYTFIASSYFFNMIYTKLLPNLNINFMQDFFVFFCFCFTQRYVLI